MASLRRATLTRASEAMVIASKNPVAVTGSKVMINYARDHGMQDALDYIALWQTGMFSRPHMAEAFKAQQESARAGSRSWLRKRSPKA